MSVLADLDRRISRALEQGRGMQLNAAELDLLAMTGSYCVLHTAAEAELREQAACRDAQRRKGSTSAGPTGSSGTGARTEPFEVQTSRSSGTTRSEDASEALQAARDALMMGDGH
jgi:hypothetical protein